MRRWQRGITALAAVVVVAAGGVVPALAADGPPRRGTEPPPVFSTKVVSSAEQLALAMDVPQSTLRGADLMGSDANAAGVEAVPLSTFPSQGNGFAVISTGLETSASLPNSAGDTSTELGGLDNDQGQDLVRLHLALKAPIDAECLGFDFGFLSEEFPEFVGSTYNDTFTAQINTSELSTSGSTVIAPNNFALDTQGNQIDVNTVFGVTGDTGTTYDGATQRLRASTPVVANADVDLYLSIQDLDDSIYDSAAFLDNFFWSRDANCRFGSTEDTDGDGLLDDWETGGLHSLIDGVDHDVDLPAMGADPNVPDIFVEIDYMVADDHTHRPDPAAIAAVIESFAAQGVRLHVDYGADAPLRWGADPNATWGALSQAEPLPHADQLGTGDYDWGQFDALKAAHFDPAREAAFHYNVWSHLQSPASGTSSGLSRGGVDSGGASDFIVSLGGFTDERGSTGEQTGTFMHELGHNLGLGHGGGDSRNYKPNYLSIMNYSFQLSGLPDGWSDQEYDYSRERLFELPENGGLDEADGIHTQDPDQDTVHYACGGSRRQTAADAIDWNCDGDTTDLDVAADVNKDGDLTTLEGNLDWGFLTYTGGSIGLPGSLNDLPAQTPSDEYTLEQYQEDQEQVVAPVLGAVTVPATPVEVGTAASTSAAFTVTSGSAAQVSVLWTWGDGTSSPGAVTGTGTTGSVTGSHTWTRAGVYPVTLTLTAPGGSVTGGPADVVVYDPGAGVLTGAGRLAVPAGSYAGAPALAGTVDVGFAASYLPGRTVPVAALALRWPEAGLTVTATSARYLVVGDGTARLAGAARIGGAGSYQYELTAVDGKPDLLRLVVWDPALGPATTPAAVVLDTAPTTHQPAALAKGQILITRPRPRP